MGVALAMVNVTAQTIMQERAPEEMRGRIFAVQLTFGSVASIIPLVFIGSLADRIGILIMLGLVGIGVLGVALFSILKTRSIRAAATGIGPTFEFAAGPPTTNGAIQREPAPTERQSS
jgi:MFS family permease